MHGLGKYAVSNTLRHGTTHMLSTLVCLCGVLLAIAVALLDCCGMEEFYSSFNVCVCTCLH